MKIIHSAGFSKSFKKRIKKGSALENKFKERISLFIENPHHPILRNHKLTGKLRSYCAISITGDVRLIYSEEGNETILLVDIGTHAQVYGK